MEKSNLLIKFATQFFNEIGAEIDSSPNMMVVKNIPPKFEKFYGKKGPYKIVYDKSVSNDSEELLTPESYLLKAMRGYLDNKGSSTLVKLKVNDNIEDILKENLELPNSKIIKVNLSHKLKNLTKFTFQTNYSYLNQEEKIVNELILNNGLIADIDLSKFSFTELKPRELPQESIKQSYELAKIKLKELIFPKTQEIASELDSQIDDELKRINEHFEQQVKEIDDKLRKLKERLIKKDPNSPIPEEEINSYESKKKEFERERDFSIQNENKKYALKISTKLLNTTIIMYPLYDLEVFLKSQNKTKLIIIPFNPLNKELLFPNCERCLQQIKELILCNGSHIVCRECATRCEDCNEISCEICLSKKCAQTDRKICRECGLTCYKCKSFKHKRFMNKDNLTNKPICKECN